MSHDPGAMTRITVLDGPLGTELARRGASTALPRWSASALTEAPALVAAIHRDYAAAGATVHTANTFRASPRAYGAGWVRAARDAVALARGAVPRAHRVAGSLAPLADCYRPDLSPGGGPAVEREHGRLAEVLADAGCDLLLCETFPCADEALAAVRAARATRLETWLALSAGYDATLMSPAAMADAARRAVDLGVAAVLVNCTPSARTRAYVEAIADAGVPFGAYANGGVANDEDGFTPRPDTPEAYAAHARAWVAAGATIVGGCCGTGPAHVAALAAVRDESTARR
ncbi:MAG: homocysteine S-methyltransferase family protein [Sandaracinaceae bacterium]|nr:homocysteine S-methyltransferase family protein [Sandaracinaceae bacterium]